MSEHLEAAIESMRQSDLALDEAEKAKGGGALDALADALGHERRAVTHLIGAVQILEDWRTRIGYRNVLSADDPDSDAARDVIG